MGFVAGLVFIRVVDRPARHAWFAAGTALIVVAWALPALLGPGKFTLVAVMLVSGLGNSFAGESVYKIWSQELFPTLLRATATGVTWPSPGPWPAWPHWPRPPSPWATPSCSSACSSASR